MTVIAAAVGLLVGTTPAEGSPRGLVDLADRVLDDLVGEPEPEPEPEPEDPRSPSPDGGSSGSSGASVGPEGGRIEGQPLVLDVSDDLACQFGHLDLGLAFFLGDNGDSACATLVSVDGVLYGPEIIHASDTEGGESVWNASRVAFTPVAQSASGSGTATDPYTVTTEVGLADTGHRLVQIDRYIDGTEHATTEFRLHGTEESPADVVVYRVGDCLAHWTQGYSWVGPGRGACVVSVQDGEVARPVPGDALLVWTDPAGAAPAYVGEYEDVWAPIAQHRDAPLGAASGSTDNGIVMSWAVTVPADGVVTLRQGTTWSSGPARTSTVLESVPDPSDLVARLRIGPTPLVDQLVRFDIDGVPVCQARTDVDGIARCGAGSSRRATMGRASVAQAAFDGSWNLLPARASMSVGPPRQGGGRPVDGPCADVDHYLASGVGFLEVTLDIAAPSCPGARFRVLGVYGAGDVRDLGFLPGDGTDELDLWFEEVPAACIRLLVTDGDGNVLDAEPGDDIEANGPEAFDCLQFGIGPFKFR